MFTKALLVTLILVSSALALTSRGNATPRNEPPTTSESNWMERASKVYDGGGN